MLALALTFAVTAQINTPAPSPASTLSQTVGLTQVTIEYSRPSMRGRTIFGDLVPFNRVWRTGANARTKIAFDQEVTIGDFKLDAGTYAIFTIPQPNTWDVIFYSDYQGNGAPREIDDSKVSARVTVKTKMTESPVESFTIALDNVKSNSAEIRISWEKTYISIPFSVSTDVAVMASIKAALSGPSAQDYYAAATYMFSEGKDIGKAKMYIDKAMSMIEQPGFWQLRQQSLIYAASGDTKGAIEVAKQSLAASEAAGNADYVKMNKESLAEWQQ